MKLWEFLGHRVRIACDDGQVFEGFATNYESEYDNDPDPECLMVDTDDGRHIDFEPDDIISIEALD